MFQRSCLCRECFSSSFSSFSGHMLLLVSQENVGNHPAYSKGIGADFAFATVQQNGVDRCRQQVPLLPEACLILSPYLSFESNISPRYFPTYLASTPTCISVTARIRRCVYCRPNPSRVPLLTRFRLLCPCNYHYDDVISIS